LQQKSRGHTMILSQPAEQKQQRCHNTLFSITFPLLWLQTKISKDGKKTFFPSFIPSL
jgi:hypothetical protein